MTLASIDDLPLLAALKLKLLTVLSESTELSCMPLIYWSTQTTAEINLLQPEEEPSTKEKDGILGGAGLP